MCNASQLDLPLTSKVVTHQPSQRARKSEWFPCSRRESVAAHQMEAELRKLTLDENGERMIKMDQQVMNKSEW